MAPARVELAGTVIAIPERRATPNGTPVLRFKVDCGDARERLPLELVVIGTQALQLAGLHVGQRITAQGNLHPLVRPAGNLRTGSLQIEVVAQRVAPSMGAAEQVGRARIERETSRRKD